MPKRFSPDLVRLITGLLAKDPQQRLGGGQGGAQDIKEHPFFKVSSFLVSVIIQ
jgi:hypothetical protein